MMSDPRKAWSAALVRTWLDRRSAVAKLDQAAAEEWVCNALKGEWAEDQAIFAARGRPSLRAYRVEP